MISAPLICFVFSFIPSFPFPSPSSLSFPPFLFVPLLCPVFSFSYSYPFPGILILLNYGQLSQNSVTSLDLLLFRNPCFDFIRKPLLKVPRPISVLSSWIRASNEFMHSKLFMSARLEKEKNMTAFRKLISEINTISLVWSGEWGEEVVFTGKSEQRSRETVSAHPSTTGRKAASH